MLSMEIYLDVSRSTRYTFSSTYREEIPLGTIAVQQYNRPRWTFNKIIFIEKKGTLQAYVMLDFQKNMIVPFCHRRGYASVKDLFDLLGETEEEINFSVHDADAGTKIFETRREATSARPGRKVKVINLGLDPEEAIEKGFRLSHLMRRLAGARLLIMYHGNGLIGSSKTAWN